MPDPLLLGVDNSAGTDLTILESPLQLNGLTTLGTLAVTGMNPAWDTNPAVTITASLAGVHPMPQDAVDITTSGGIGVSIDANDGGEWDDPNVVLGTGVASRTQAGTSISATTATGHAIVAASTDPTATHTAVTITNAGAGRALFAESTAATNNDAAMIGITMGTGSGVRGENRSSTAAGVGVIGVGDAHGRGGEFAGGASAMRLVPSTAATHPTTGIVGDLFVDASARLWFCKKSSTGSVHAVWTELA